MEGIGWRRKRRRRRGGGGGRQGGRESLDGQATTSSRGQAAQTAMQPGLAAEVCILRCQLCLGLVRAIAPLVFQTAPLGDPSPGHTVPMALDDGEVRRYAESMLCQAEREATAGAALGGFGGGTRGDRAADVDAADLFQPSDRFRQREGSQAALYCVTTPGSRLPLLLAEVSLHRGVWLGGCTAPLLLLSGAVVFGVSGSSSSSIGPLRLRFEDALHLSEAMKVEKEEVAEEERDSHAPPDVRRGRKKGLSSSSMAAAGKKPAERAGSKGSKKTQTEAAIPPHIPSCSAVHGERHPDGEAENKRQRPSAGRSAGGATGDGGVRSLVEATVLGWGTPRMASSALRAIFGAALRSGFNNAAAMALHLTNGSALVRQHLLASEQRPGTFHASREAEGKPAKSDGAEEGSRALIDGALEVYRTALLPEDMSRGADSGTKCLHQSRCRRAGGLSQGACEQFSCTADHNGGDLPLLRRLDCLAERWLQDVLLPWLPPGSPVCSITVLPSHVPTAGVINGRGGGRLLLSRLRPGRPPLLVLLPERGCHERDQDLAGAQCEGTRHDSVDCPALGSILHRLDGIMRESSDSMKGLGVTAESSQAQKVEWWKVRVILPLIPTSQRVPA